MHDIRKSVPNLLPVLLLICISGFTACTHPVRRLVFQPHKIQSVPTFPADVPHLERFWLKTEQGDVEWWLFEGNGVDSSHPGPAVLMAHGNRELIDFFLNRAEAYQRMGFTVLLGEYRGYGRSAGTPSRKRIASDFRRFYDHLISLPTVDSKRIVFHGRSLGGSVLSELSRHRPPAAIIVESTFMSIKAMAHGAPELLLSDNYDTVSALLAYLGPVLIIHGTMDNVVPVKHALEMKKHIPTAELILYDCGHSDGPPDWEMYWKNITEFLDRVVSN
ncbi:MAG: alpha/beta hydrolase [Deltaproteobacteria bacterium]|nr:alpha/beta hydrolase [Deltaproteobacteria bacterium]